MENMQYQVTLTLAEVAAGTDQEWYAAYGGANSAELVAAYLTSASARTANDTNYTTISIKKGSTTYGSLATTTSGTGSLTAGQAVAFALSSTGTGFSQGGVVEVHKDDSGSGLAFDGSVSLVFQVVR